MSAPRKGDDALADALGVSSAHAAQLRKRLPAHPEFAEFDQSLRAEAALADLDAVRSIDEGDIEDLAEESDPVQALKDEVAERSERVLRARLAAHASWAKTPDRSARTAAAREGLLRKFEREVDPDGTLPPEERAKRAENARQAHYLRMALKGVQARRAKAQARRKGTS